MFMKCKTTGVFESTRRYMLIVARVVLSSPIPHLTLSSAMAFMAPLSSPVATTASPLPHFSPSPLPPFSPSPLVSSFGSGSPRDEVSDLFRQVVALRRRSEEAERDKAAALAHVGVLRDQLEKVRCERDVARESARSETLHLEREVEALRAKVEDQEDVIVVLRQTAKQANLTADTAKLQSQLLYSSGIGQPHSRFSNSNAGCGTLRMSASASEVECSNSAIAVMSGSAVSSTTIMSESQMLTMSRQRRLQSEITSLKQSLRQTQASLIDAEEAFQRDRLDLAALLAEAVEMLADKTSLNSSASLASDLTTSILSSSLASVQAASRQQRRMTLVSKVRDRLEYVSKIEKDILHRMSLLGLSLHQEHQRDVTDTNSHSELLAEPSTLSTLSSSISSFTSYGSHLQSAPPESSMTLDYVLAHRDMLQMFRTFLSSRSRVSSLLFFFECEEFDSLAAVPVPSSVLKAKASAIISKFIDDNSAFRLPPLVLHPAVIVIMDFSVKDNISSDIFKNLKKKVEKFLQGRFCLKRFVQLVRDGDRLRTTPSPWLQEWSPEERTEAAVMIQAGFRGHQVRRVVNVLKEQLKFQREEEENQRKVWIWQQEQSLSPKHCTVTDEALDPPVEPPAARPRNLSPFPITHHKVSLTPSSMTSPHVLTPSPAPTPQRIAVGKAVKSGMLWRLGAGTSLAGTQSWKQRWFCLTSGEALFFSVDEKSDPIDQIAVTMIASVVAEKGNNDSRVTGDDKNHVRFVVTTTTGRRYTLKCRNGDEWKGWCDAFELYCGTPENPCLVIRGDKGGMEKSWDRVGGSVVDDGRLSILTDSASSQSSQSQRKKDVRGRVSFGAIATTSPSIPVAPPPSRVAALSPTNSSLPPPLSMNDFKVNSNDNHFQGTAHEIKPLNTNGLRPLPPLPSSSGPPIGWMVEVTRDVEPTQDTVTLPSLPPRPVGLPMPYVGVAATLPLAPPPLPVATTTTSISTTSTLDDLPFDDHFHYAEFDDQYNNVDHDDNSRPDHETSNNEERYDDRVDGEEVPLNHLRSDLDNSWGSLDTTSSYPPSDDDGWEGANYPCGDVVSTTTAGLQLNLSLIRSSGPSAAAYGIGEADQDAEDEYLEYAGLKSVSGVTSSSLSHGLALNGDCGPAFAHSVGSPIEVDMDDFLEF